MSGIDNCFKQSVLLNLFINHEAQMNFWKLGMDFLETVHTMWHGDHLPGRYYPQAQMTLNSGNNLYIGSAHHKTHDTLLEKKFQSPFELYHGRTSFFSKKMPLSPRIVMCLKESSLLMDTDMWTVPLLTRRVVI